jgi:hypothetical protein
VVNTWWDSGSKENAVYSLTNRSLSSFAFCDTTIPPLFLIAPLSNPAKRRPNYLSIIDLSIIDILVCYVKTRVIVITVSPFEIDK